MATACKFYAADWAGIIELDLDLGITTTGWWYNADSKVTKLHRMNEYENIFPIDKTTYIVRVHFSETATETMADKIKRMLRDEVRKM